MQTKRLTICAFFIILFSIGARITIPTGWIPLTMQTMMVTLAGMLLKPSEIGISYGVYFLMGLLGLPVFANGGGIGYILQPSFGFLLAFPFAAGMISFLRIRFHFHHFLALYPICLLALLLIYTIGCLYMYAIFTYYIGTQKDMQTIVAIGAMPFLISDSISIAVGCFCALRMSAIHAIHRVLTDA